MTKGLSCYLSSDQTILYCSGKWIVSDAEHFASHLSRLLKQLSKVQVLDAKAMIKLDSTGALLLNDIIREIKTNQTEVQLIGFKKKYLDLLALTQQEKFTSPIKPLFPNSFYQIGKWFVTQLQDGRDFCDFLGRLTFVLFQALLNPARVFWPGVAASIEENGYKALPIVSLLSFLVGIVVTYQVIIELELYNATLYIVDFIGIITLREFGPLIVAIIAAGRTSTAFAAQIGTMKVGEELDALNTMGISPLHRLVLPKILGLLIALPLLTVWSDILGVLGGLLMAKISLNMHYVAFLNRFEQAIPVRHYYVGLIKTPFFALIIAAVGCFQGFQVTGTADSVGKKTTQSAVQAIFLIIVADSLFSIFLRMRGI